MRYLVVLLAAGCSFRAGLAPSDAPADVPRDPDVGSAIAIDAAPDAEPIDAPPDAPKGIHFVQGSGAFSSPWGTSSETLSLTMGSDVAEGDVIAIFFSWDDHHSVSGFADSANDEYHYVDSESGDHDQEAEIEWTQVRATGPLTITATMNDADCCLVLFAHEIAGVASSNPIDGHTSNSQSGVDASTDNVTSHKAGMSGGDYVFAGTTDPSNSDAPAIMAGTGETLRVSGDGSGGNATATEDKILTASASTESTFTFAEGSAITVEAAFAPAD